MRGMVIFTRVYIQSDFFWNHWKHLLLAVRKNACSRHLHVSLHSHTRKLCLFSAMFIFLKTLDRFASSGLYWSTIHNPRRFFGWSGSCDMVKLISLWGITHQLGKNVLNIQLSWLKDVINPSWKKEKSKCFTFEVCFCSHPSPNFWHSQLQEVELVEGREEWKQRRWYASLQPITLIQGYTLRHRRMCLFLFAVRSKQDSEEWGEVW